MINENKKIKFSIGNIFDVVLIILILFLLLCSYINVSRNRISTMWVDETASEITMTVMLPEIENEYSLTSGDKLYFKSTGEYFGTIKSVSSIYKSTYKVYKKASIAKRSFTDESVGLSVKLEVPLKKTSKGTYINESIYIAPGSEFELYKHGSGAFVADVNNITFTKSE